MFSLAMSRLPRRLTAVTIVLASVRALSAAYGPLQCLLLLAVEESLAQRPASRSFEPFQVGQIRRAASRRESASTASTPAPGNSADALP